MRTRPENINLFDKQKPTADKDLKELQAIIDTLTESQISSLANFIDQKKINLTKLNIRQQINLINSFIELDKDKQELENILLLLTEQQKINLKKLCIAKSIDLSRLTTKQQIHFINSFLEVNDILMASTDKASLKKLSTPSGEYKSPPPPTPLPVSTALDKLFLAEFRKKFDKPDEADQIFQIKFGSKIPSISQIINHLNDKPRDTQALLDTLLNNSEFIKESIKDNQDLKQLCDKFPTYKDRLLTFVFSKPELFKLYCCNGIYAFCKNFPEQESEVYAKIGSKLEYFSTAFPNSWALCDFLKTTPELKEEYLGLILTQDRYFISVLSSHKARYLKKLCDEFPAYKERFLENALKNEEIARTLYSSKSELEKDFADKITKRILILNLKANKIGAQRNWDTHFGLTLFNPAEAKDSGSMLVVHEPLEDDSDWVKYDRSTIELTTADGEDAGWSLAQVLKAAHEDQDAEEQDIDDCEYNTPPPSPR